MIQEPRDHTVANWALALILGLLLSIVPRIAFGQKKELVFPTDPGLALARVCVSECTWSTWCCAGVNRAIHNKARRRGMAPFDHLKDYSDEPFNRARTDHRAWIAWLREDGAKPNRWPKYQRNGKRHPPWRNFRRLWLTMVFAARRLWGSDFNPCEGEPIDWGNREDLLRYTALNPCARIINCGPPGNYFLVPTGPWCRGGRR